MGRKSTVAEHPQRTRIDNMLDDGVSYADIVRTVGGTSLASVGRYALSRKSELARHVDGDLGVTEILSRLVEAYDHSRELRRQSKLTGSPVAQARAIKLEAEVLSRMLSELGIDDVTVTQALKESQSLVTALTVFFRTFPDSASDLIEVFSGIPETEQLAQVLRARLERQHDRPQA